jgi:hypothetical protein
MFNIQSQKIIVWIAPMLILTLLASPGLGLRTGIDFATPSNEPLSQGEPTTPLQVELENDINQRRAAGLPVPAVTYSVQASGDQGSDALAQPQMQSMTDSTTTVTSTTIIYFQGPQEAGHDKWPALEISGELGGDAASFETGDLSEVYHGAVEEEIPGYWEQVEFGQEARRYIITETHVLSSPSSALLPQTSSLVSTQATTSGDILMGFTYSGPKIKDSIGTKLEVLNLLTNKWEVIYELRADYELDWALGLRLPASVTLTSPDLMVQGNSYNFQASLTPQDWNESQYSSYGAAPEGGNEFVFRFNLLIDVVINVLGTDYCQEWDMNCHVTVNKNELKSFTTPFGTGSTFPLTGLTIPIFQFGSADLNFGVDITFQPILTSTKIEAEWHSVPGSDCFGSGLVAFNQPDIPVLFGPITACGLGPTDQAQVELENFRYYFNQFLIRLDAIAHLKVFNLFSGSIPKTIHEFDLSSITSGLFVGDHVQCTFNFDCSEADPGNSVIVSSVVVDKTPPITSILLNGTEGANGWHVSDVQVSLSAIDGPTVDGIQCGSGVNLTKYSFDNSTWYAYTGPFMITEEGITTIYYRSTDNDGNVEAVLGQIIKIDKTPPIITGATTTLPNLYGWWNTDVIVHFETTDAVSGIAFVTPDVRISSEGANQSVNGVAMDMAGNIAQVTVNNINIDKTPPVVTIINPLPQTYYNTDSLTVHWSALDALSGIAAENGNLDGGPVSNGQLIELLLVTPGNHIFSVVAVDKADNVATDTVDFFVNVDIDGLTASVNYMCEQGWISGKGICNSLVSKLNNVKAALDRGSCKTAKNLLFAFMHEVEAQSSKAVTEKAVKVLKANTLFVIENLECASAGLLPDGPPDKPGKANVLVNKVQAHYR